MAKKNDVGLVLVVGILILLALYIGVSYKSIGVKSPTISTTNTTNSTSTAACSSSVTPTLSLAAYYNNTSTVPSTPTQVATSYEVYQPSSPLVFASGTTSATAATSISDVNCGSSYNVFLGDNTNYYLTEVPVSISQTNQNVQVKLEAISAPTVQFNNGTIAGYVDQAKLYKVPNGYTDTNLQMRVSAGSGFWGNPKSVIEFAYNSTQIQSIKLSLPTATVPSSAVSVPAGFATIAYEIPAMSNYEQNTYNPVIVSGTLPSNTLNASAINVYLISESSYNNNGAIETGLFTNPSTQAPLVTPVSSVATSSGTGGILVYG